jgi:hypothetical protein
MSIVTCPYDDSVDCLPVAQIFLDISLDRLSRPLSLHADDNPALSAIDVRGGDGCIGITTAGQFVPMLGRTARDIHERSFGHLPMRDGSGYQSSKSSCGRRLWLLGECFRQIG